MKYYEGGLWDCGIVHVYMKYYEGGLWDCGNSW